MTTRNSIAVTRCEATADSQQRQSFVAASFSWRSHDCEAKLSSPDGWSSSGREEAAGRSLLPSSIVGGIPPESITSHTLSPGLSVSETEANLSAVQRLFSMFPTGAAGIALILLRVSVAATLVTNALPGGGPDIHAWEYAGLGLLGGALCLGVFTPVSSTLSCIVEIASAADLKEFGATQLISSILITASLAMLGPGAYSVDARMFGRRLVVSSSDNSMEND
jgi:hypothetical protein